MNLSIPRRTKTYSNQITSQLTINSPPIIINRFRALKNHRNKMVVVNQPMEIKAKANTVSRERDHPISKALKLIWYKCPDYGNPSHYNYPNKPLISFSLSSLKKQCPKQTTVLIFRILRFLVIRTTQRLRFEFLFLSHIFSITKEPQNEIFETQVKHI